MGISPKATAMQAIGYKEFIDYLAGNCTLEDACAQVQQSSRHYAKRQLTWFERDESVIRLPATDEGGRLRSAEELAEYAVREFRAAQMNSEK